MLLSRYTKPELFQLWLESADVGKRHLELRLVWTMAAKLEIHISRRPHHANRDFQQCEPDSIDPIPAHGLRQHQTAEPVEELVRQSVDLNTVGVHDLSGTADIAHVETGFELLDVILHLAAFTVMSTEQTA